MKTQIRLMAALAIVLVIVSGVASAPVAASGVAEVPFKAWYETHPVTVGAPDGIVKMKIPSEGRGTHLGNSTWYADSWVDMNSYPWVQTGVMMFTAANGDQLLGGFAGSAIPTASGVEFWGDYWIAGGTGRFEGVTGSGTYQGAVDGEVGMLYFDGTLLK